MIFRPTPIVLCLCTLLAFTGCERGDHPEQVGSPAPLFTVADGTHTVALNQFRGKVVVLNFWATWCAPCIEELPTLVAMQKNNPQVAVVAVSTDEDPEAYTRFLGLHPLPGITTVRDGAQKSNSLYGTFRFPETYIIDRQGMLRRKFIGPQVWTSPEIAEYLAKL